MIAFLEADLITAVGALIYLYLELEIFPPDWG